MQWLEIRFRFADNKPGLPFSFPACVRFAVTQSVEHGLEPFFQAGVCAFLARASTNLRPDGPGGSFSTRAGWAL